MQGEYFFEFDPDVVSGIRVDVLIQGGGVTDIGRWLAFEYFFVIHIHMKSLVYRSGDVEPDKREIHAVLAVSVFCSIDLDPSGEITFCFPGLSEI